MSRRKVLQQATMLLVLASGGQQSQACSCGRWPSIEQAFEEAAAAFLGTIVAVEQIEQLAAGGCQGATVPRYTFEVAASWKGVRGTEVAITSRCICQFHGNVGDTWVVFAQRSQETSELVVGICSRSQRSARATETISRLDCITERLELRAGDFTTDAAAIPQGCLCGIVELPVLFSMALTIAFWRRDRS